MHARICVDVRARKGRGLGGRARMKGAHPALKVVNLRVLSIVWDIYGAKHPRGHNRIGRQRPA
eukprot:15466329-Alexandrium_andersonii.AAC.1